MIDKSFALNINAIIKEVGAFIQNESKTFNTSKIQNKSSFDLVSYVDIESEKKLMTSLNNLLPEAGFIAEETPINKREWNWIIDPLDGTTNFTRNLPAYAISVALEHNNEIEFGAVYNIPTNELFYAIKNNGAFLNNTIIQASNNTLFANCLIATGFSVSKFDKTEKQLKVIEYIVKNSLGIRRMGAAAVDLCYTACGRFDAFFEWHLNPWDVAAGALIAKEANAVVTDFSNQNNWLFGQEILAAQTNIHKQVLSIINQ